MIEVEENYLEHLHREIERLNELVASMQQELNSARILYEAEYPTFESKLSDLINFVDNNYVILDCDDPDGDLYCKILQLIKNREYKYFGVNQYES